MTTTNTPLYASQARPWLKYYDPKFIDQTLPECSAFDYVRRQNQNRLSESAMEYYGRKFTYADLIVNVKKTAAAFRAVGVKKGDIITVVSVMTPEVIYAFYAADRIGATLNLVDPRYSPEGIHEYIEEVDSHLLLCLNVTYELSGRQAHPCGAGDRDLPGGLPAAASGHRLQGHQSRPQPLQIQRADVEAVHRERQERQHLFRGV